MLTPSCPSVELTVCWSCASVMPTGGFAFLAMCTPVSSMYAAVPSTVTSPRCTVAVGVPVVPSDFATAVDVRPAMSTRPAMSIAPRVEVAVDVIARVADNDVVGGADVPDVDGAARGRREHAADDRQLAEAEQVGQRQVGDRAGWRPAPGRGRGGALGDLHRTGSGHPWGRSRWRRSPARSGTCSPPAAGRSAGGPVRRTSEAGSPGWPRCRPGSRARRWNRRPDRRRA